MPKYEKGKRQPNQGGLRDPPGGRPTREQAKAKETAEQYARRRIERAVGRVMDRYEALAEGAECEGTSPTTTQHFINKLVPDAAKTIKLNGNIELDDKREQLRELSKKPEAVKLMRELMRLAQTGGDDTSSD